MGVAESLGYPSPMPADSKKNLSFPVPPVPVGKLFRHLVDLVSHLFLALFDLAQDQPQFFGVHRKSVSLSFFLMKS